MKRLLLLGSGLLASCGGPTGGAFQATVAYHLNAKGDACLKVRASPSKPAGLSSENTYSLKNKAADGSVKFGILAADDWSGDVTITASLFVPCSGLAVATDTKKEGLPSGGRVVKVALSVSEPGVSIDGGTDAGIDAGPEDAGTDAGPTDAGSEDAGTDAGMDAGTPDAGVPDAGPKFCDGGLTVFPGPPAMTSAPWHDFAPYPGGVWLVGAGALYARAGNGWAQAHASCFSGDHKAGWARGDGRVYFGTVGGALRMADPDGGACVSLTTPSGTGDALGIVGFVDGGVTFVYTATSNGTILRNTDPEVPTLNRRWDFGDAGVDVFWTIDGADESGLFAGGEKGGNGLFYKYNPATDAWAPIGPSPGGAVNEVTMVTPSRGYAGTQGADLYEWNGSTWSRVSNNQFGAPIYGAKAFAQDLVYAVGSNATARRWNGSAWTTLGAFDAGPGGYLSRIKGTDVCDVWGGGSNGLLIHNSP